MSLLLKIHNKNFYVLILDRRKKMKSYLKKKNIVFVTRELKSFAL